MSALRMCEDAVVRAVPDSRERARLAREAVTRLGRAAPELAPYQDEPPQMPSGVVGKFGFLRLVFRADGARSVLSDMDRRAPFLVQKALYWDEALPDMPCVMIITTTGCVAQGDRLAVQIHVGAGARAQVPTQSATKIHMMSSNYAAQLQEITVEEGGYLEYAPDPVIPHRSSRFLTDTRLAVAESGALVYSEILLPGRKHHHKDELFGFDLYSSRIAAHSFNTNDANAESDAGSSAGADSRGARRGGGSRPFFVEKFILEPKRDDLTRLGVMSGYEVFGNALVIGPADKTLALRESVDADVDKDRGLAWGGGLLPGGRGLVFRALGRDTESVQAKIREFRGLARKVLTGADLPPEFLWR